MIIPMTLLVQVSSPPLHLNRVQEKAKYRRMAREFHAKDGARRAAIQAVRGDSDPAADAADAAASAAAAPKDPGLLPRFRTLATLPEIKASHYI